MDDTTNNWGTPAKRRDVGYKRPPSEHQFKKGQPRPPRKAKENSTKVQISKILGEVLKERHRVPLNGKVQWVTAAELVLRRAAQEAEKGNSSLRREVTNLLMRSEERAGEPVMRIVADPSGSSADTGLRLTSGSARDSDP